VVLSGVENEDEAGVDGDHERNRKARRAHAGRVVVLNGTVLCSLYRDLGDGCADRRLIHHGLVRANAAITRPG
jgi:hypothetical protein